MVLGRLRVKYIGLLDDADWDESNEKGMRHLSELGMHQFQFWPIPIPILGLELLELVGTEIGIDWNWLELELELVGIEI